MAASQAIQARYGRRAGWLRYHMARTLDSVGAFAPLRRVAWNDVERLVFVCQGNICRSAYADARARLAGLRSVSFGLSARDGDCANSVALARAAARGVDLSAHRATSASAAPMRAGDLRIAMEPAQIRRLARLATVASPRRSVRSFARVLRYLLRHHRFGGRADRTPRSAGARTIVEQRGPKLRHSHSVLRP